VCVCVCVCVCALHIYTYMYICVCVCVLLFTNRVTYVCMHVVCVFCLYVYICNMCVFGFLVNNIPCITHTHTHGTSLFFLITFTSKPNKCTVLWHKYFAVLSVGILTMSLYFPLLRMSYNQYQRHNWRSEIGANRTRAKKDKNPLNMATCGSQSLCFEACCGAFLERM